MKISIITAVYNAEDTVIEAINSVARQSYPDIEHLIIEGKSKDKSMERIKSAMHDRMSITSAQDNGIYDAFNKGITQATGDVVGFVHSDDYLSNTDVIKHIAEAFSGNDVSAVFGDLDYVSQFDTSQVVRRWATGPYKPNSLKRGWMPAHPTLYVRKQSYERLGLFDTNFKICADYDFILRLFSDLQGQSIYLSKVLYKMRLGGISNRNLSTIKLKMEEDYLAIKRNKVGGFGALACKNLSKLGQFLPSK